MFIKPIHVMFLNFISLNFVISLELFHFSCNFYRYNNNEDFNFFRAGSITFVGIYQSCFMECKFSLFAQTMQTYWYKKNKYFFRINIEKDKWSGTYVLSWILKKHLICIIM